MYSGTSDNSNRAGDVNKNKKIQFRVIEEKNCVPLDNTISFIYSHYSKYILVFIKYDSVAEIRILCAR